MAGLAGVWCVGNYSYVRGRGMRAGKQAGWLMYMQSVNNRVMREEREGNGGGGVGLLWNCLLAG